MIQVFGEHDLITLDQFDQSIAHDDVKHATLCANGAIGFASPQGSVIAHSEHLSLTGVGFDIACGNRAVKLDVKFSFIKDHLKTIMADIAKVITFGNGQPTDTALFEDARWYELTSYNLLQQARQQLGTLGSGGHFVKIFVDENDYVWIGVQTDARGFGNAIAAKYMKLAAAEDKSDGQQALLHKDNTLAHEYLTLLDLAGVYATLSRELISCSVQNILGAKVIETIDMHHNFLWKEFHEGEVVYVAWNGATPAVNGQRRFINGSMGDISVIVKANAPLKSIISGAGKKPKTNSYSYLTHLNMRNWLAIKDVVLCGGTLDEAPQAYRRLNEVLAVHKDTIEIEHTLTPKLVFMAN